MIKNVLTSILIFFSVYYTYSQTDSINIFQIQYERLLTFEDDPNPLVSLYEYTKFIELNKSIFKKKSKFNNSGDLVKGDEEETILYYKPSENDISVVFKDYEKNEFYVKHEIAYKYFVVKDRLEIYNWNILNENKEILGFNCQLATMDFRGRKYEAWFTPELPVGGPWKFDGLPGMILEINSMDNFITYNAVGVKNAKIEVEKMENPFKTKKALTWNEFKSLYKKKAIELLNYRPNENSAGLESSRGGIEIYIDENDVDYNMALKQRSIN